MNPFFVSSYLVHEDAHMRVGHKLSVCELEFTQPRLHPFAQIYAMNSRPAALPHVAASNVFLAKSTRFKSQQKQHEKLLGGVALYFVIV